MRNLFLLFMLFSCFGAFSQKQNEIDVDWTKVCQPQNREAYFNCLDSLYKKYPADSTYLHVLFEKAIYYNDTGVADSVIKLSRFGIEEAQRRKGYKSETMKAAFMNLLAAKYQMQGQYGEATDLMLEALKIFEKNGNDKYASILNFNIGAYYTSLKDYSLGKKYFSESYERFKTIKDTTHMSAALIALSECHFHLEEYENCKTTAELSYELAKKSNYLTAQISYFWITGSLYKKEKKYDEALQQFNTGEALTKTTNIYTNYYLVHFVVDKMKIYNAQTKYLSAIEESKKLEDILSDPSITIILHDYHEAMSKSYFGIGNTRLAYEHLEKAYTLKNQTLDKENKEIVSRLTLEYETEKKERQIAEQELEIQKKNVQMRNRLIAGIIIIAGFLTYFFVMRRNQKNKLKIMEKEKENEVLSARVLGEEVERSRISKELHDGIASNLVAVKLQVENNAEISQKILSLVQETHKEVRQIAHNLMPIDFEKQNLVDVIKSFCEECTTDNRPVNFQTNVEKINLDKDRSMVLYRTVQEFIQNAIKHSQAKQIDVFLMENKGIVSLNIEDNGIGFDSKLKETSKGLSGIIDRLEKIKGRINIDSSDKGTSVFISIKTN